jgi:hypothetical protein
LPFAWQVKTKGMSLRTGLRVIAGARFIKGIRANFR